MRPSEFVTATAPFTGGSSHGSKATASANGTRNEWGAFQNARSCAADMAIVLGILVSTFVLGLVFMATLKLFLRWRRGSRSPHSGDAEKPGGNRGATYEGWPTVYAAGATELAGAGTECAICLTEFADGDALRMLPTCRHGFHLDCVGTWLASSVGHPHHAPLAAPVAGPGRTRRSRGSKATDSGSYRFFSTFS